MTLLSQDNEFDWDEQTQGYILSAFFWGYVLTHIPGGLLAERFGGKQTLGLGILSTSVLTLLTPLAARAGPWWLITVRFVEGLGEVSALCTRLMITVLSPLFDCAKFAQGQVSIMQHSLIHLLY